MAHKHRKISALAVATVGMLLLKGGWLSTLPAAAESSGYHVLKKQSTSGAPKVETTSAWTARLVGCTSAAGVTARRLRPERKRRRT